MNNEGFLLRFSKISLVFVFIVIIAGSIVRMTGSGMGCPDWPKCFGYYIPPTDAEALTFREGKTFDHGQMVVQNDTLWVSDTRQIAGNLFDHSKWHKYAKHDYAVFNPIQTWIEYINRLATGLFVMPVLVVCALAFSRWRKKKDRLTMLFAFGALFMIGFEAWLGKLVVDGNLHAGRVTLHMVGSLAIILFLQAIIYRLSETQKVSSFDRIWRPVIFSSLILTFIQVLMGTQVREQVDIVASAVEDRSQWIALLPAVYKAHRSFSILVVLFTLWMFWENRKLKNPEKWISRMTLVVLLEVVVGFVLTYFEMPKLLQPTHLFFAVVLFAIQSYLTMKVFVRKQDLS